jgi:hypothetical protein
MRRPAQAWVTPYLVKFMGDHCDASTNLMFKDLSVFKEKLRQIFSIANEPSIAEQNIQHLRQTKSAGDYANKFQKNSIQTNWNDASLITMY